VAGDFGLRFYAGVPLTTHDGFNLGTLCVIDHQPRAVTIDDIATLRDLAGVVMDELELRRSALHSVQSEARLRESAEELARTLQASLLPPQLPSIEGLDLAARYNVAHSDEVGGDFYDVIPTDAGCAVVVGDACGKGTRAAALAGTARWTLRTVTMADWTPGEALATVNRVLVRADESPERYVTLALVSLLPRAGGGWSFTVALGGHPHPLILRADGRIEAVGQNGPLVGCYADADYIDSAGDLEPGDALVLFTDGTLEAVAGHGETDDRAVRNVLAPVAGGGADEVADALDRALGDGKKTDDAAILVVRAT
jgi:sigma-B regulation protein RsbU (phosphoserine phosphatase)